MNKKLIFGSIGLLILGGVAFFYFKKKNKNTLIQKITEKDLIVDVPISTTTTTPDKVLDTAPVNNTQSQEEATKRVQAQSLATQIWTLKSQFASLQNESPTCYFTPFGGSSQSADYQRCTNARTQILDTQNRIKALGYKEDNGLAIKI